MDLGRRGLAGFMLRGKKNKSLVLNCKSNRCTGPVQISLSGSAGEGADIGIVLPAATWVLAPGKRSHWEFKGKKSPGVSRAGVFNQGCNW